MKYKIIVSIFCIMIHFSLTPSSSSRSSTTSTHSTVAQGFMPGKLSTYLMQYKKYIDELNDHIIAEKLRKNPHLIDDNIQIAIYSGQCPYTEILLIENKNIKSRIIDYQYDQQSAATLLHSAIEIAQYHKYQIIANKDDAKLKKFYTEKYKKMLNIIQILIDNEADLNAQDCYGMTPLHKACYCNDIIIAHMLVDEYANIHIRDNNQKKAEDYVNHHGKKNLNTKINADYENLVYKLKNPPVKKRSLYACIIASLFGESIKIVPSS